MRRPESAPDSSPVPRAPPGAAAGEGRVSAEPSFEESRQELELIVAQLESGHASLEDSVALWERGEELYRICVAKLDAAQGKIEELGRRAGEVRPPGETSDAAERPDGSPPSAG
jgi:exodeoxyribonuclease VII small subunit